MDTTSRFKYIAYAYDNMKKWLEEGTEGERKLKRYMHRHLSAPPESYDDETKELMTQFGYHYVISLLNYCSDDLKEGILLVLSITLLVHTQTYCLYTHQVISSCPRALRMSSRGSPSVRFVLSISTQSTLSLVAPTSWGEHGKRVVICQRRCSIRKKVARDRHILVNSKITCASNVC